MPKLVVEEEYMLRIMVDAEWLDWIIELIDDGPAQPLKDAIENGRVRPLTPAEENGGWISVEDRLPEEGVHVLMRIKVSKSYNVCEGHYRADKRYWVDCWCAIKGYCGSYPITHWQPLPDEPVLSDIDKE